MRREVATEALGLVLAVRADMNAIALSLIEMRADMVVMRQDRAGILGSLTLRNSEIAKIKVRLERVERRPDLVD